MQARAIDLSWRHVTSFSLLILAAMILIGGHASGNHLLTNWEKTCILAADGNPPATCYYINQYY